MSDKMPDLRAQEALWDKKEFNWQGKTFYFVPVMNIFHHPIGLGDKLEQLNREIKKAGYKVACRNVIIEYSSFGGKAMIEIEPPNQFDANLLTFDDPTKVYALVHPAPAKELSKAVTILSERVSAKGGMDVRKVYYLYDPSGPRTIVLGLV